VLRLQGFGVVGALRVGCVFTRSLVLHRAHNSHPSLQSSTSAHRRRRTSGARPPVRSAVFRRISDTTFGPPGGEGSGGRCRSGSGTSTRGSISTCSSAIGSRCRTRPIRIRCARRRWWRFQDKRIVVLAALDACDAPPIGAKIWAHPEGIVANGLVHRFLSSPPRRSQVFCGSCSLRRSAIRPSSATGSRT
jgi:hypothetical protein